MSGAKTGRATGFRILAETDVAIEDCGYHAMAIVGLCELAVRQIEDVDAPGIVAGRIAIALELAGELIGLMHEEIETRSRIAQRGAREAS